MPGGVAQAAAQVGQQLLGSGVLEGSGTSDTKGSSSTKGVNNTNKSGVQVNKGIQVSKGTSKGTNLSEGTTTNKGVSTTTGGTTINQTTKGTADQGALDQARGISDQALKAVNDKGAINSLINSTLGKAAIAFAPTLAAGTSGSGLYNSSTVDLLSGFAKGQAVADSTQAVLNYKQGEQQIATQANQGILDATKGSVVTGGTTNTSTTGTDNTGTTNTVDNTTNVNANTQRSNDKATDLERSANTVVSNTNTKGHTEQVSKSQQNGLLDNSLVCAAMMEDGNMDRKLWTIVTRHFINNTSSWQKKSYWGWSAPFVKYMRKKPNSLAVKFVCWLTHERAVYVAAKLNPASSKYKSSYTGLFSYCFIWIFSCLFGLCTLLIPYIKSKNHINLKSAQ